jgi:hypothetical protein
MSLQFQDKGIMKNVKNQYVPIQQKRNEEKMARLIPKRKVQVGGNDEISMKIQKVMNTPGPASGVSNSLEQNMKEDKYESVRNENTLLNANRMIFGPSDIGNGNTARTCENGDFDKNMNIADSNVDQYKHDISIQNIVERRTPELLTSDAGSRVFITFCFFIDISPLPPTCTFLFRINLSSFLIC